MLCLRRMRALRGYELHRIRVGLRSGAELSLNWRTVFRNGHQAKQHREAFTAWRKHWRASHEAR